MQPNHGSSKLTAIYPQAATIVHPEAPDFYGVSANTVGATGLSMQLVEIPPGGQGEPHSHCGFETAIYLLAGRIETRFGEGLRQSVINGAGSFLFIPPGVLHQPINLSATQPALAVIARNNAQEEETTKPYTK